MTWTCGGCTTVNSVAKAFCGCHDHRSGSKRNIKNLKPAWKCKVCGFQHPESTKAPCSKCAGKLSNIAGSLVRFWMGNNKRAARRVCEDEALKKKLFFIEIKIGRLETVCKLCDVLYVHALLQFSSGVIFENCLTNLSPSFLPFIGFSNPF